MAHASQGGNKGGHLRAFADVSSFVLNWNRCTFGSLPRNDLGFAKQRVRRSCKRMAAKLNCMAVPDQAFAPGAHVPGGSSAHHTSSTTRTPVHYGAATARTPSRSTSRTSSRAASRGKLYKSHKTRTSLTRKATQEMKTRTLRFFGCHRCSTLLLPRRLRVNPARYILHSFLTVFSKMLLFRAQVYTKM